MKRSITQASYRHATGCFASNLPATGPTAVLPSVVAEDSAVVLLEELSESAQHNQAFLY